MGRKPLDKARLDNPAQRKALIDAILPHFLERGLSSLSMDEMAMLMGKSKATVYKYFKSRDEIVETALTFKLGEILQFKAILQNRDLPTLDRYFMAIHHIAKCLDGVSAVLMQDILKHFPEYLERIQIFRGQSLEIWRDFYKQGIDEGVFYPIDPYVLAVMDRVFFQAVTDNMFGGEGQPSLKKAMEEYYKLKLHGLIRDKSKAEQILLVPELK